MAPRRKPANSQGRKAQIGNTARSMSRGWVPTFSRSTLYDFEDEKTHENMYHDLNKQNPGSHETWGATRTGALSSIKKKGKAPRLENYFTGQGSLAALFRVRSDEEPTMIIPNGPDTSRLLGLPVEVRENIYGFLLSDTKPVVVGPDWETVQGLVLRYNSLQYVCKQLGDDATTFLYKNNVFLAMLRQTRKHSSVEKTPLIDPKFLSLFRNVVINCPVNNWSMDWHEQAALAVNKLADANSFLTSLTIVVCPNRGEGTSTTALGLEANPIHFADFFYFEGPLMTSIRRLRCKVLNIIVKKRIVTTIHCIGFTSSIKRLLITVDLTYLPSGMMEHNPLANEETVAITLEKTTALEDELRGLKDKFEAIFENVQTALSEGLCRELAEDEAITDGMALATRK